MSYAFLGQLQTIRSKTQEIPGRMLYPHPDDPAFKRVAGFSIFLAEGAVATASYNGPTVEGLFYNYEDRLAPYFGDDFVKDAAREAEAVTGNKNTAAYFEALLQRVYEDQNVELQHITGGVEGGFPYLAFGTLAVNQAL